MKVILTHIHNDGVLTEVVDTIELGADLFCDEIVATTMADIVVPGCTLFEDEWGLFYVHNANIISIQEQRQ